VTLRLELVDRGARRRAHRRAYHRRVVDAARRGTFVGREAELELLIRAYAGTATGESRTIVLAGEAGIGKTRLVATFTEDLAISGARILVGGCLPLGTGGLPYGPFVEAFRALFRDVDAGALSVLLGPSRGELARLMPEVRGRPDRVEQGSGPDASAADGSSPDERFAQVRLFELVLGVLERLSRISPVVVVVEDVQWADRSTQDLLAFLVRNLREERVLLVATMRTDEIDPQGRFLAFLAELERGERVDRIDLARFNRDELARLLADELGHVPDAGTVDRILERTDGNPFYAEQVVAASRETGGEAVPARLRDVVLARVSAISDAGQELLRVASAAGARIDDGLLESVCDLPAPIVRAALREVVDRRILVRAGGADDPHVAFQHSLLREVIHAELLPAERAQVHARYAEALEARAGEMAGGQRGARPAPTAADLAYHWDAAGDDARALPAMVEAARVAESGYAYLDAHRRYLRSIELSDRLAASGAALPVDPVEVLVRAAETAVLVGEYDSAIDLGRRAIAGVDARVDPERGARLLERQRWYLWVAGDLAAAAAALAEANRLVPLEPPSAARAHILAHTAGVQMSTGRFADSLPIAEEALDVARAVGSRADEALALGILGTDLAMLGRVDDGIERFREGLAIAEDLGGVEGIALGTANLATLLDAVGRPAEALDVATAGWERARSIGVERTYGGLLLAVAAKAAIALGRWDEADGLLALGLARDPVGTPGIRLRIQRGRLDTMRGDFARAAAVLDAADAADEAAAGTTGDRAAILAARADLAAVLRRTSDVRAAVAEGLRMAVDGPPDPALAQLAAAGLRAEADAADRARAERDEASVAGARRNAAAIMAAVERIAGILGVPAATDRTGENGQAGTPSRALALSHLCRAEAHRLEETDTAARWVSVADAFDAIGRPYPAAYARYRAGAATLRDRGDRGDAGAALSAALATAVRLRARPLVEEIETLARHARLDLGVGDVAPATEPATDSANRLGLTDREAEVLAFIAAGWSNQEIADALFISRKTVSVHASNIFDKLGAGNRSEAGSIARRLGLDRSAPPPPGSAARQDPE
jgi:DNA-binding CsgD family transcriptional regulator/tetratricopeptide (TPR) repeat protein